jgi:hypothetical protein
MHEIREIERAGTTLNRMDRTKYRIDRLGIEIAPFDRQQAGFEFEELLFALLEKDLFDFFHRVQGATPMF